MDPPNRTDVFTTVIGGGQATAAVQRSTSRVGFESGETRPPDGTDVAFIDYPFTKEDLGFEDHLAVVEEYQPALTVAPDVEKGRALGTVVEQADELARHADDVVVVPKDVHPSDVPDRFRVGLPLADYGSDAPHEVADYIDVGPCHLLGGSPTLQHAVARTYVDVASLDGAALFKAASFHNVWTADDGWREVPNTDYYERVRASADNLYAALNGGRGQEIPDPVDTSEETQHSGRAGRPCQRPDCPNAATAPGYELCDECAEAEEWATEENERDERAINALLDDVPSDDQPRAATDGGIPNQMNDDDISNELQKYRNGETRLIDIARLYNSNDVGEFLANLEAQGEHYWADGILKAQLKTDYQINNTTASQLAKDHTNVEEIRETVRKAPDPTDIKGVGRGSADRIAELFGQDDGADPDDPADDPGGLPSSWVETSVDGTEHAVKHAEDGNLALVITAEDPGYVVRAAEGGVDRRVGYAPNYTGAEAILRDHAETFENVKAARSFVRETGTSEYGIEERETLADGNQDGLSWSVGNRPAINILESNFASIDEIREATDDHLASFEGVGPTTIDNIREEYGGPHADDRNSSDDTEIKTTVESSGLTRDDPATEITGIGDSSLAAGDTVGDFWDRGCPFSEVAGGWQDAALEDILGAVFVDLRNRDHIIRIFAGYTAAKTYDKAGEQLGNYPEAQFQMFDWDRVRWAWAVNGFSSNFVDVAAAQDVVESQAAIGTGEELPARSLDFDPEEDTGLSGLHTVEYDDTVDFRDSSAVVYEANTDAVEDVVDVEDSSVWVPENTIKLYSQLFGVDYSEPRNAEHVRAVVDTGSSRDSKERDTENPDGEAKFTRGSLVVFDHPTLDLYGIAERGLTVEPDDFDLTSTDEFDAWAEQAAEQIKQRRADHRGEMQQAPSKWDRAGVAGKDQLDDAAGVSALSEDDYRPEDRDRPERRAEEKEMLEGVYEPSKEFNENLRDAEDGGALDPDDGEQVTVDAGSFSTDVPRMLNGWAWTEPADDPTEGIGHGPTVHARWERDGDVIAVKGRGTNVRAFYWVDGQKNGRFTIHGPVGGPETMRHAVEALGGDVEIPDNVADRVDDEDDGLADYPDTVGEYGAIRDERLSKIWTTDLDRTTTVGGKEQPLTKRVEIGPSHTSNGPMAAKTRVGPKSAATHTLRVADTLEMGTEAEVWSAAEDFMTSSESSSSSGKTYETGLERQATGQEALEHATDVTGISSKVGKRLTEQFGDVYEAADIAVSEDLNDNPLLDVDGVGKRTVRNLKALSPLGAGLTANPNGRAITGSSKTGKPAESYTVTDDADNEATLEYVDGVAWSYDATDDVPASGSKPETMELLLDWIQQPGETASDDSGLPADLDPEQYDGEYKNQRMENAHYWAATLLGWMKNGPNAGLRGTYYVDIIGGKPQLRMDVDEWNESNVKAIRDGLRDYGFPSPIRMEEFSNEWKIWLPEPSDERLPSNPHPDWREFEATGGHGGDRQAQYDQDQLEWDTPNPNTSDETDETDDEPTPTTASIIDEETGEKIRFEYPRAHNGWVEGTPKTDVVRWYDEGEDRYVFIAQNGPSTWMAGRRGGGEKKNSRGASSPEEAVSDAQRLMNTDPDPEPDTDGGGIYDPTDEYDELEESSDISAIGGNRRSTLDALDAKDHLDDVQTFNSIDEMANAMRELSLARPDGATYMGTPDTAIETLRNRYEDLPEQAKPAYLNDDVLHRRINAARKAFNRWMGKKKREQEMPSPMEAGPSNYPADKARETSKYAREASEELTERIDKVRAGARGARQRALESIGSSVAEQNEQEREERREEGREKYEKGDLAFYSTTVYGNAMWGVKRVNDKSLRLRRPHGSAGMEKPMSDGETYPEYDETRADLDSGRLEGPIPPEEIDSFDADDTDARMSNDAIAVRADSADEARRIAFGEEWVEDNLDLDTPADDGDGDGVEEYFVIHDDGAAFGINGPFDSETEAENVRDELGDAYHVETAEEGGRAPLNGAPDERNFLWIDYDDGGGIAGTVTRVEGTEALIRVDEGDQPSRYDWTTNTLETSTGTIHGVDRVEVKNEDATEMEAPEDPTGGYEAPGADGLSDAIAARGINHITAGHLADTHDSIDDVAASVEDAADVTELKGVGDGSAAEVRQAFGQGADVETDDETETETETDADDDTPVDMSESADPYDPTEEFDEDKDASPDDEGLPWQARNYLGGAWSRYKQGLKEGREAVEAVEEYQDVRTDAAQAASEINEIRAEHGQDPIDFDGVDSIEEIEAMRGELLPEDVNHTFEWEDRR